MANTEYGAVKLATLTGIANAIRQKDGSSGTIKPVDMATKISNIPTGNSDFKDLVEGTIVNVDDDTITSVFGSAFLNLANLKHVRLRNVTAIASRAFNHCQNTDFNEVFLPSLLTAAGQSFYQCTNLVTVDMGQVSTLESNTFYYTAITNIILRSSALVNLSPFISGDSNSSGNFGTTGTGGTIYVPAALKSDYETAYLTGLTTKNANNKFAAIEGSIYE